MNKGTGPNDSGRWPTDEFGRFEQDFTRYLAPHSAELSRLSTEVKRRKHPWGFILLAAIIAAIGTTVFAWNIAPTLGYIALAAAVCIVIYVYTTYAEKSRLLREALDAVDHYAQFNIMHLDWFNPLAADPDLLSRYQAFGVMGGYDDIQDIKAYLAASQDSVDDAPDTLPDATPDAGGLETHIDPIFTYADLTRTETETYKDSQGRTQTRTRTVNVFKGILFDMVFPDAAGEARTLISTRRIRRPAGVFDRRVNGKPIKMDAIKPASLEFQKLYNVKCDDATLGHHILEPDRVMRFINLHHDLITEFGRGTDIIIMIMDGRAWVGIETGSLQGLEHSAGKIDRLAPTLTKFARQLSTRQILQSHLKLPQTISFPWQGEPDNTV